MLQVPFQLKFKLGNGAFGYNLMIGLALILIGIATIAGFTRLIHILSRRDAPVEQRVRRSSVFSLGLTTALFITALAAPGGNFVFYFIGLGLLVAWIGHTSFCILRARDTGRSGTLLVRLRNRVRALARQPWPFNGIFWLLVFLALVAKDLFTITEIDGATSEAAALYRAVLALAPHHGEARDALVRLGETGL